MSEKIPIEKQVKKHFVMDSLEEYKKTYQMLVRAVQGTSLDVKKMSHDLEKDIEKIRTGKINIEVGSMPYYQLKQMHGGNRYVTMSEKEYFALEQAVEKKEISCDCFFSAFFHIQRGVSVTVKESQAEIFIKALESSHKLQQEKARQEDIEY